MARVGRVRRAARRVPEEWSSRVALARTEPGLQAVWHFSGIPIKALQCPITMQPFTDLIFTDLITKPFQNSEQIVNAVLPAYIKAHYCGIAVTHC
jgi:hypothetical protein